MLCGIWKKEAGNRIMKKGVYPLYDLPQVRNLRELVELKYRSVPGNTAFSYLDKAGQKVLKTFRDV